MGCDDNRSLGHNVYAASTAFPIWLQLYKKIDTEKLKFAYDTSLQEISVDPFTGQKTYFSSARNISLLV